MQRSFARERWHHRRAAELYWPSRDVDGASNEGPVVERPNRGPEATVRAGRLRLLPADANSLDTSAHEAILYIEDGGDEPPGVGCGE